MSGWERVFPFASFLRESDFLSLDKTGAVEYEEPHASHAENGKKTLDTPKLKGFGRQYLEHLGPELLAEMGYSYSELHRELR